MAPRGVDGNRPNQPRPEKVWALPCRAGVTSVRATSARQISQSSATKTTASNSCSRPPGLELATQPGAAHAAPSGVQATTCARRAKAVEASLP